MSAWTPANLSTPPICWLKADALSLNDGDLISSWIDSSGNLHSANGSGGTRPVFKTGIINSLPVVRMDGSKQMLVTELGTALSTDDTYTVFFLTKPSDVTNYPIILTHPTTGSWDWIMEYNTDGGFFWGQQNPSYRMYSTGVTSGSINMLTLDRSSASAGKLFKNGSEITTFSTNGGGFISSPSMSGDMLMGQYTSAGFGFTGDLAEIVIFNSTLNDSDRQAVEGYLSWKWGVQSQLPGGHPYKNAPPASPDVTLLLPPFQVTLQSIQSLVNAGAGVCLPALGIIQNQSCLHPTGGCQFTLPVFPPETRLSQINPAIFIASFEYVLASISIIPEYQFEPTILPEYSADVNLGQEYKTSLEVQPCRNAS